MTVNEAEKATKALAEDTGADLAVSEAGDVVYAFRSDAKARLAGKSFAVRMEPAVEKAKGVSLYLVRVSFGAALVSSVVVVYTSIIALLSSGGRGEDRDDGRDRGPGIAIYRPITPGDMFLFFDPYPRCATILPTLLFLFHHAFVEVDKEAFLSLQAHVLSLLLRSRWG